MAAETLADKQPNTAVVGSAFSSKFKKLTLFLVTQSLLLFWVGRNETRFGIVARFHTHRGFYSACVKFTDDIFLKFSETPPIFFPFFFNIPALPPPVSRMLAVTATPSEWAEEFVAL